MHFLLQTFFLLHFLAFPHFFWHFFSFIKSTHGAGVVGGWVVGGWVGGWVGGETVVPDGFLGHSFVPVVDLTQSMTSRKSELLSIYQFSVL